MPDPGNESNNEKVVLPKLTEETRIIEDMIQQNINKMLPISQPEDGYQHRIVKSTSDGFKESIFMKPKQRKEAYIEKH